MIKLKVTEGFHMKGIAKMANLEIKNDVGAAKTANGLVMTIADTPSIARFCISSAEHAQTTLTHIDKMIEAVDSQRAQLGAIQNRMESTIRNQSSIAENESDARSRIRDTDFASETASLTQNQIIQQASQTILSQANQRPTVALSLLGG